MATDPVSRPCQLQIRHIDFAAQIPHLEELKQNDTSFNRTAVIPNSKTVWFNVTSSHAWTRPDVGVIRTEKRLREELHKLLGVQFATCKWNGSNFVRYNPESRDDCSICEFNPDDYFISFGLDWDHTFHQLFGKMRRDLNVRIVACCYDLIPILFPQYCVADTRAFFGSYFINVAEGADVIFCISKNTRRDLQWFLDGVGARKPRLEVFRLGEDVAANSNGRMTDNAARIPESPYALYVATLERRKNHNVLYQALRITQQAANLNIKPKCVFVGMHGWGVDELMSDIALDPLIKDSIVYMSDVSDAELQELYINAQCVLFPSFYEGWGLPVSEALSHGKAVFASDSSSIPEIGGDLVNYLDPLDPKQWAEALVRVFNDDVYRLCLEQRVKENHQSWTWTDCAKQVIEKLPILL